jgi:hypothetical protein
MGGSFCTNLPPHQPPATLCSDFDEASPLAAWAIPAAAGDAGLSVDDSGSFSPPNSLRVDVPSLASGASAYAGINQTFSFSSSVRVDFEYRATAETDDKIAEFVFPSGYAVGLVLSRALPALTVPLQETIPGMDGGAASYVTPSASFSSAPNSTGSWVAMSLAVSAPTMGGAATATVQIGNAQGTATLAGPGSAFTSSQDAGLPVLVRLGAVFVDQSPTGWSANFDNVVVYAQ